MPTIRPYASEDLPALYDICLATGAAGSDAGHLYHDRKVLGHVYAAPYAVLEPESAYVVEDAEGVGGYIVGTHDTRAFETQLESEWWPELRTRYSDPSSATEPWTPDQRMAHLIHNPPRTPRRIAEPYPAHLHINLLPRFQGDGIGRLLIRTWLARMAAEGAAAAHLGVGPANARAVRFYQAFGFREIERLPPPYNVIWFGISTGA
jgi:ribosomal protein S18 acetylase RimI-like enzyme